MENLTVLHDDNTSFIDHSANAFDYTRDTFSIDYTTGEDSIYIGYRKPFNDIFIAALTAATVLGDISATYYNGTAFTPFDFDLDDTKSITRSGFLNWNLELEDWASTSIDGKTLYWIKLDFTGTDTVVLEGINTIFSYDNDLKEEYRNIFDYINAGDTSFISTHQAVRKAMIQKIRNMGKTKFKDDLINPVVKNETVDVNIWDLLDRDQLKMASVHYAIAKIFENVIDGEGLYESITKRYNSKGDAAFNVHLLTIDENDNGVKDSSELRPIQFGSIVRE